MLGRGLVNEIYELNGQGEVDTRDSGRSQHIEGHGTQVRAVAGSFVAQAESEAGIEA